MRRFIFLLIPSLLCLSQAIGQSPNGTINGIVLDPSGAAIAGAEVVVVNDATGVQYATKTNGEGIYVVPNLSPGSYRIQVSNSGFKTIIKPEITLNVQDALAINFTLPIGSASEIVTVPGGAPLVNTQSASVSTVINNQFVESLPLNGRSFNTLLQLTPGVVIVPTSGSSPGQFSIAGQRSDANNFLVDGVSANFGISSTVTIGGSGTGTAQALSALGGTSSLISVEALQEFRVETSSFAPEFGRSPGGQIMLTTRSGTNAFHGGLYEYFRNDVMDANDWFANAAGLPRAPERHNDFGGFLGGPIARDKTFFFLSYEGARLRLPQTKVIQVPSLFARSQAPAVLAPFLNAFPLPNAQPASPTADTATLTGVYSNSATLNAGSIRMDHTFSSRFAIFARYNDAPSQTVARVGALNVLDATVADTRTLTIAFNAQLSKAVVNTVRGNYSTQNSSDSNAQDSFGGSSPLDTSLLLGGLSAGRSFLFFDIFDANFYSLGTDAANRTQQWNLVDDLSWSVGTHQLKFGADERALFLNKRPFQNELIFTALSVQSLLSTGQATLMAGTAAHAEFLTQSLSAYAQDTWKLTPRLTAIYGLRWELSPPPSARGTTTLAAWNNVNRPADLSLAPAGTPLWKTTFGNLAPRLGIAYALNDKGDLVVRAGGGIFYDSAAAQAVQLATTFPNFAFGNPANVSLPLTNMSPSLPVLSLAPPFPNGVAGYTRDLTLPRSYQWNVAVEKSFVGNQVISVTYLGQAGRSLVRQVALAQPNAQFSGDFLAWENAAFSNYNALQFQYRRPVSSRLQILASYAWSHSLDNSSNDSVAALSGTLISGARDYASSDFDIRNTFSGALTYRVPGITTHRPLYALTSDWSVDTVFVARSGFPFNGVILFASPDVGGEAQSRPDLVPGQTLWVPNPAAGGGKSLNPAAFSIPSPPRQGTEGRNDIRGFGLTQMDLSLGRKFPITEHVSLQFRSDAFNLLNHPNFANPQAFVELGTAFLSSTRMANQGLGGLNPLFQEGGPRSLQLSLKLSF